MKILLVEDGKEFLFSLQKLLDAYGHSVTSAENGALAWDIYSRDSDTFDVVVTDIKMPVLGGLELLKKIRNGDSEIPVILMTGHGDLEGAVQALKYEAFDFMIKPFELKDLVFVLEKLENLKTPVEELKSTFQSYEENMSISIQSHTSFIPSVVRHLHNHFKSILAINKINRYKFALCLQEALTNAIVHGNLEISSAVKESSWSEFNKMISEREKDPHYCERRVRIDCTFRQSSLSIQIEDEGNGFDFDNLSDPNDPMSLLCSGRGILMIRQFMNEVEWNETGNVIRMVKSK